MIRNCIFRYQSLDIFYFFDKIKDSRHFQLAVCIVFYAESESAVRISNSFTLRRKLRKTDLRESRFLIVRFLIIRFHLINSFKGPYQGGCGAPYEQKVPINPYL